MAWMFSGVLDVRRYSSCASLVARAWRAAMLAASSFSGPGAARR